MVPRDFTGASRESQNPSGNCGKRKISEENLAQETSDPGGNCGSKKG